VRIRTFHNVDPRLTSRQKWGRHGSTFSAPYHPSIAAPRIPQVRAFDDAGAVFRRNINPHLSVACVLKAFTHTRHMSLYQLACQAAEKPRRRSTLSEPCAYTLHLLPRSALAQRRLIDVRPSFDEAMPLRSDLLRSDFRSHRGEKSVEKDRSSATDKRLSAAFTALRTI